MFNASHKQMNGVQRQRGYFLNDQCAPNLESLLHQSSQRANYNREMPTVPTPPGFQSMNRERRRNSMRQNPQRIPESNYNQTAPEIGPNQSQAYTMSQGGYPWMNYQIRQNQFNMINGQIFQQPIWHGISPDQWNAYFATNYGPMPPFDHIRSTIPQNQAGIPINPANHMFYQQTYGGYPWNDLQGDRRLQYDPNPYPYWSYPQFPNHPLIVGFQPDQPIFGGYPWNGMQGAWRLQFDPNIHPYWSYPQMPNYPLNQEFQPDQQTLGGYPWNGTQGDRRLQYDSYPHLHSSNAHFSNHPLNQGFQSDQQTYGGYPWNGMQGDRRLQYDPISHLYWSYPQFTNYPLNQGFQPHNNSVHPSEHNQNFETNRCFPTNIRSTEYLGNPVKVDKATNTVNLSHVNHHRAMDGTATGMNLQEQFSNPALNRQQQHFPTQNPNPLPLQDNGADEQTAHGTETRGRNPLETFREQMSICQSYIAFCTEMAKSFPRSRERQRFDYHRPVPPPPGFEHLYLAVPEVEPQELDPAHYIPIFKPIPF